MAGQDDSSGYHRTSQGTATDFVNAGNKLVTLRLKPFFFSKGWYLGIIYLPHPLCPPLLQRRGGREVFEGALPLQSTLFLLFPRPKWHHPDRILQPARGQLPAAADKSLPRLSCL